MHKFLSVYEGILQLNFEYFYSNNKFLPFSFHLIWEYFQNCYIMVNYSKSINLLFGSKKTFHFTTRKNMAERAQKGTKENKEQSSLQLQFVIKKKTCKISFSKVPSRTCNFCLHLGSL